MLNLRWRARLVKEDNALGLGRKVGKTGQAPGFRVETIRAGEQLGICQRCQRRRADAHTGPREERVAGHLELYFLQEIHRVPCFCSGSDPTAARDSSL
jgi:hypothetical protein